MVSAGWGGGRTRCAAVARVTISNDGFLRLRGVACRATTHWLPSSVTRRRHSEKQKSNEDTDLGDRHPKRPMSLTTCHGSQLIQSSKSRSVSIPPKICVYPAGVYPADSQFR
jgi:hypothetical protein